MEVGVQGVTGGVSQRLTPAVLSAGERVCGAVVLCSSGSGFFFCFCFLN